MKKIIKTKGGYLGIELGEFDNIDEIPSPFKNKEEEK